MDVDFATYGELKLIEKILHKFGFKRVRRSFTHDNCPFIVDFVNPPIAVGHEAIHQFEKLKMESGLLVLLLPIDCVKDRLASFFYWDDIQAFEQALLVEESHQIDLENLKQ